MSKNLIMTVKYGASQDPASGVCMDAVVLRTVDAHRTLAPQIAPRVLRPCRMVPSSIFKIRRVRTLGAFKQYAVALRPNLADAPH
jgi:hypothetical protein